MAKMVSLGTKMESEQKKQQSIELIDEKVDNQDSEENKLETFSIVAFAVVIMAILIYLLS